MSQQVTDQQVQEQEEFEFTIDGKKERLSLRAVEDRLRFDAANTKRSQEIAREKEAVEAEKQRMAEERTRLSQERNQLYTTLDTLVKRTGSESEPEPPKRTVPSYVEALKGIDFVSDSEAPLKLAQSLEKAQAERDEAQRREHERQIAQLRAEFQESQKKAVAEVQQQTEVKLTRHTAAEEAHARNNRVFQETLNGPLAELPLTDQEINQIKQKALTTYSDDGGVWDGPAGVWLPNERGILEAARTVDTVFDKMRAADRAAAKTDGLRARLRGEDASRSTPNRSRPAFGGEPDDSNLVSQWELLNRRLQGNYITPEAAMDTLRAMPGGVEKYKAWKREQEALLRSG